MLVFLGLISAGMSTLEGLIQSLSIIITNDLIDNVHDWSTGRKLTEHRLFLLNRVVIVGLAVLSFGLAYWQLVAPNLSVIIFAQLGVYAYFAAAFVPVLFGTFFEDTPTVAVVAAAVTAVVVHFGLYYTGQYYFPYYIGQVGQEPGDLDRAGGGGGDGGWVGAVSGVPQAGRPGAGSGRAVGIGRRKIPRLNG